MTKQQRIKALATLLEKQYRKGVQHGAHYHDKDRADEYRLNGSVQGYTRHTAYVQWKTRYAKDHKRYLETIKHEGAGLPGAVELIMEILNS